MTFPLSTPGALTDLARAAAGQILESAASIATVPVRVLGLLGQGELLLSRVTLVAERTEALIERLEGVVTEAEKAVGALQAMIAAANDGRPGGPAATRPRATRARSRDPQP
ncbi:hypothetical protein EV385_0957 [Krasilnikovia cinnamomea]|uniref:Uncharacterized protein n=1 Tax=Krasilnikovia cinnamomea TaxID=349313 RepID=A0A4Q7ZET6_9ACTN|nr:hypothetical protein [Krasilnikovia cinnamomea]RZU49217.1 hypothetical protein EV385_0957 [Krasilnikovia cinnamomea]